MITFDGLVTGIDTTTIIEGLTEINQRQVSLLENRKTGILDQQTAYKALEAHLVTFRSSAATVSRLKDNPFDARIATSSDEDVLVAAASGKAPTGTYTLRVNSLARNHQLASQSYTDTESRVTQGTLDIQVGSGTVETVTIDSSNDTVQGLVDAINGAGAGVSASLLNDGTGFRVLLSSNKTGSSNAIAITNNLGPDGGGAIKPLFATTVQAAADASISFGSGAGAINITSASNTVENVIPDVTISLLSANSTKDITLSIAADEESAVDAVTGFVDSYNSLIEFVTEQTRFESETGVAGTLLGDRSVSSIQGEIQRAMVNTVPGLNPLMNNARSAGMTINDQGKIDLNVTTLQDALGGRTEGVTPEDVRKLFVLDGSSDNGNIRFILGNSKTKESTNPYQVDISTAAERATILATNALAASTVIDGTNNTLDITVDGQISGSIVLNNGTYSRQELADELEAKINDDSALGVRDANVLLESDKLRITSISYGTSSEVKIGAGNALASLGFDGTEADTGSSVVGSFIVDGVVESATGTGRILRADSGNANTEGIQLEVSLTASDVVPGAEGNLTITRGLAARIDEVINNLLDPVNGKFKTINDSFDERIEQIDESIARQNEMLEERQQFLLREFVALERAVSELRATGDFLAAQLLGVQGLSSGGGIG